jgi:small conductance mechanosensitive channel
MDYALIKDIVSTPTVQICLVLLAAIVLQTISKYVIEQVVEQAVRAQRYRSRIDEKKRTQTLSTIFRTAADVIVWIAAALLILSELGVNIAALATGAGLVGVIVGLGAQSAISDILAGVFIIAENQYRVGDVVTLTTSGKPISGVVEDISIRITKLRDLDGNLHIVRNGQTNIVTNLTFDYANVNIDIDVSYDTDIDRLEHIINTVGTDMAADDLWQEAIKEPIQFLRIDSFESSGVRVKVLGKVEPAKQWDVAGEFRRRIKKAFESEGIAIPFTQIVLRKQ